MFGGVHGRVWRRRKGFGGDEEEARVEGGKRWEESLEGYVSVSELEAE